MGSAFAGAAVPASIAPSIKVNANAIGAALILRICLLLAGRGGLGLARFLIASICKSRRVCLISYCGIKVLAAVCFNIRSWIGLLLSTLRSRAVQIADS
jgi:hypothetical protein